MRLEKKFVLLALSGFLLTLGVIFMTSPEKVQDAEPDRAADRVNERRTLLTTRGASTIEGEVDSDATTPEESNEPPAPDRELAEQFLEKHRRNAPSLLAAFRAFGDSNYLFEAARNFPSNPQVQWTVLVRNAFPEERGKWIQLLKDSSPDNSIANYLAAREHFASGETDSAVRELIEANGKSGFKEYSTDARLEEEELRIHAGQGPRDYLMASGWATETILASVQLKNLAGKMAELQTQYASVGDAESIAQLAAMGGLLADRLRTGDSGKPLMNHLVAFSIEAIVLKQLDPNRAYDFLGNKTPVQRQDEMARERAAIRDVTRGFLDPSGFTDAEIIAITERSKIYGELEAMRWWKENRSTTSVP